MKFWPLRILRNSQIELKKYYSTMASRIAVCQMTSVADKGTNLKVVGELIEKAANEKVQMLFFPEACDYMCENKKDIVKCSEPIESGEIVGKYKELAAKYGVWLSMGGVHERDEKNPDKMYNTHIIIDNNGSLVQTYRKLHLFDVEIPEKKVRLKESDFSNAGEHIVAPVETPVGRVGMAICYDMRFPELSTSLSIMNAEILTYPSAFTQATGEAHWHTILRARAIENQCYVIAAAQTGKHNSKRQSYGHALCVNPWGEVLADCGEYAPCYKIVDISLNKLREVRQNMPVFQHRRSDVYSLYTLSLRKTLSSEKPLTSSDSNTFLSSEEPYNIFGSNKILDSCIFYKSNHSYAFVNLRCVIPGHVLVAPIRQAERNNDLTDVEAEDFFRTIRLVQKLMEKVHNATSCTVTIQDGPDAGQTVKHLHCHVMPRKKGDFIDNDLIYLELAKHDHFKSGHPAKPARSLEERRNEAELLRNELKKLVNEEEIVS